MNIVLASIFRNASGYLDRYFSQIANLRRVLAERGHELHYAWAEGDSDDDTFQRLAVYLNHDPKSVLVKAEHGGPIFGSIDNDQRWRNISFVCNRLLDSTPSDADIVIYIESDLLWTPDTLLQLVEHVQRAGTLAVAPMCFHLPTGVFYDTWGHRKGGVRFEPYFPYHNGIIDVYPGTLTQIDSAGSCIVMRGEVARTARFDPPELGIVGWCESMHRVGAQLWLDPSLKVYHP